MSNETKPFWESVRELAAMRDQIPAERRQLSGVRMWMREEDARAQQRAELKSTKR